MGRGILLEKLVYLLTEKPSYNKCYGKTQTELDDIEGFIIMDEIRAYGNKIY